MPRKPKDAAVRHHLVPPLVRYVRRHGGDEAADALIRRFALAADVEAQADASVTVVELDALLGAAAEARGDPFLGLRLPGELEMRRYNFAELAASSSPTFRDALTRMVRYASLVNQQVRFGLEERADEVVWTQRVLGHPRGAGRHADYYALGSAIIHARRSLGIELVPRRVWFMHSRPRDVAQLERFFGTTAIAFDRTENGMALDRALLDTPLLRADARLLETADALAEAALAERPAASDFAARVAAEIRAQKRDGRAVEMSAIARRLRMSARTLQRQLEEHDTTFKDLFERERSAEARALVEAGELTLGEIAHRLGFSDVGAFGRAFKRWTGQAPGAYRARR